VAAVLQMASAVRDSDLIKFDLDELEKISVHAAAAPTQHLETVKQQRLGLFIRSLIGLDREAAKAAFVSSLSAKLQPADRIRQSDHRPHYRAWDRRTRTSL
jgi:type I restriction enzyme, R subunit